MPIHLNYHLLSLPCHITRDQGYSNYKENFVSRCNWITTASHAYYRETEVHIYLKVEDEIYCFTIGKNSNDNAAFAYRIEDGASFWATYNNRYDLDSTLSLNLRIKCKGWKMELVVVHWSTASWLHFNAYKDVYRIRVGWDLFLCHG